MKRIKKKEGRVHGCVPDTKYIEEIRTLLGDTPRQRDLLIEYLHRIQDHYHCISSHHIHALASELKLSVAEVHEVATFYHHFDVLAENELPPPSLTVRVCTSLSCEMFGAGQLLAELEDSCGNNFRVQTVPCVGRCANAPVAIAGTYPVEKADCSLVHQAVKNGQTDITVSEYIDYHEYCKQGGYQTYKRCLADELNADDIIGILLDSGLRGLGGAGFPVGRKWQILKDQASPKFIAINIDEGEPGTFKDRYYLERDPHRFLEGAMIARWATGTEDIYIYLRDEYAGCRKILEKELAVLKAESRLALPELHLRRGAGAYICGEESAMIESIEGKRGMPRQRPPYVAEVGLFGRPTLEHNMESLHWIRDLIENGADWFTSNGRRGRKGLRSFSVSGRVNKPGVYMAPAGITIRELIAEYCDGMLAGHDFYGYFPGGASGGILPASLADIPLDFDTLQAHDSFIGSAAIIVFSNHDRVKDMALGAMRFFRDESCGQCTPCRVGTAKAVTLMSKKDWDLPLLEELATVMKDASICGLGQAAPNPLCTAIKYFPGEFE